MPDIAEPRPDQGEEFSICVERMSRMIQLLRIHELVLKQPEAVDRNLPHLSLGGTMLAVVYSFYYSLIEDRDDAVSLFRVWTKHAPEFVPELDALEARVTPFREKLRLFRNRYGFHGSITRSHEAAAFDLLLNHTGRELMAVILATRDLSTKLIESIGGEGK